MQFHEIQRLRQWWVWVLLTPSIAIVWFGFIQQIVLGMPFGTNPGPDFAIWIVWLLVGISLPLLLWHARLEIKVYGDRLDYRWAPFVKRSVPMDRIKSATAKTYRPVMEYGGWGLRYGGKKRGWAYSMKGNRGVFIECHDGKCFLLGSEEADTLANAINALLKDR